ncbi:MAG: endonuclease III [Anaerofustis stercorihominis]|nr:endonuclease III [Anaerofustis stercorihominis]
MEKDKILQIQNKLIQAHPDAECELNFGTPYELLVATILSAQCTDIRVNKVTSELFTVAKTPEEMLCLGEEKLLGYIKSCGLGNSKAKNIISMSKDLAEKYESTVPDDFEKLQGLAGVGQKTANVVMANAFKVPSFAVDTHVHRVSNRIGLAKSNNVNQTEKQLKEAIPMDKWILMHHVLIFHGRRICHARKPDCENCPIRELCEQNGVK